MAPKVSVIVPIYNQLDFIRETVESVLAQDHPNIELVLSDDGSTDGTTDVLREYAEREPGRVKLVASEQNTGIAGAFNRALDAHTGDYIAWLGGDDVMLPGVTIGAHAMVGAGAVVTADVPASVVVVGNPAKVIRRLDTPTG